MVGFGDGWGETGVGFGWLWLGLLGLGVFGGLVPLGGWLWGCLGGQ